MHSPVRYIWITDWLNNIYLYELYQGKALWMGSTRESCHKQVGTDRLEATDVAHCSDLWLRRWWKIPRRWSCLAKFERKWPWYAKTLRIPTENLPHIKIPVETQYIIHHYTIVYPYQLIFAIFLNACLVIPMEKTETQKKTCIYTRCHVFYSISTSTDE